MAPHGEHDTADRPAKKLKAAAEAVLEAIQHEDQSEAHRIFRAHPGHSRGRSSTIPTADIEAFKSGPQDQHPGEHFAAIEHPGST